MSDEPPQPPSANPNDPSTHGADGRDGRGRFTAGNNLGRGNPLAGRAARIRAAILDELSPEDARAIARKLIEMCKAGDLAAIKELLDRAIGKPAQADVLERLEAIEQQIGLAS